MHFTIISLVFLTTLGSSAPIEKRQSDFSANNSYFPLQNGFPNPSADQTRQIETQAEGILPNGPPPPTLSPDGVTNLKLIALNELFEVAYFSELVSNVSSKLPGYDLGRGHDYVLDALNAIVAQEQLHLLNANGALKAFNQLPIEPCKYSFPVTDFQSAISLAATFTDVVLGTLQDVNQIFAQNGDFDLVRAVSSVIGNEAEQEGFYRLVQSKRPASQPFLTTAARDFAFTAIQSFAVPGSCPNIGTIPLKTFKPLNVDTQNIRPATQNLAFSFSKADAQTDDFSTLSLVYINAQNAPIVKSLENVRVEGDMVKCEAAFPFDEFLMHGLTIAAVTKGSGPFEGADKVAEVAIFGPGLIEVD